MSHADHLVIYDAAVHVTALGKQVIALGLKLKDLYIITALAQVPAR